MHHRLAESEVIWRDGAFVPWREATVHVLAHSLQFGSAVFEGMRSYPTPQGAAIFRARDHFRRLLNSCQIYRLPLPYTIDELIGASCELVRRNALPSCYVRPMAMRGYGAAGMVPFESPVELVIPCWAWGAYLGETALEAGINVKVSTWNRVAPNTIPAMAKIAGNYLSGQLIKMEALADGYDEAIALGVDGMISEGSAQNVFVVMDGALYTPPLDGTILPGITRDTVMTLARDQGIAVTERAMPREMLYACDELFLVGTASEITPVRSVDRIVLGAGRPGELTRELQRRYLDLVHGRTDDSRGWLTHVSPSV